MTSSKRMNRHVAVACAGALLMSVAAQADAARYIVLYKQQAVPADAAKRASAAGGNVVAKFDKLGIAIAESSRDDFAVLMASDTRVHSVGPEPAFAVPEYTSIEMPADAPTAADDLYNSGLVWGVERIHAPDAWAAGVTGSHDTTVAVIDTGIAWNHRDLTANVTHVACYTSAGAWVGPYASGAPCNPYPSLSDHGTHVAGTVAAAFGGGRVVGVGPNLALAGYNTFESIPGCGVCAYSSTRWMAMLDAAERGFEVINMSLGALGGYGGRGSNDLATFVAADNRVANAVIKAGTTIVASAGNSAVDLNGVLINLPGGLPGVVNVGAAGIQPNPRYQPGVSYDTLAFYSNYGASVDVAAPGGDCGQIGICDPATRPANWFEYLVLSSIVAPNPTCAQTASCAVGYGWKAGTSMAAPHVAGVAGLIRDQNPSLSAREAAVTIKRTAEQVGSRQEFGHGIVDARAAIE